MIEMMEIDGGKKQQQQQNINTRKEKNKWHIRSPFIQAPKKVPVIGMLNASLK